MKKNILVILAALYIMAAANQLVLTQVNQEWAARYNGPGNGYDRAKSIAVDGSGNIYVTGQSLGSGTGYDYATIKYNSAGVQQWVSRYNGPANGNDYAISIAVDALGNVYVTGQSDDSSTHKNYATVKYNTDGVQLWAARYNGPGNVDYVPSSMKIDASGNVYVTGTSGTGTAQDYATVKYNSAGTLQWVRIYDRSGNVDQAYSLAVDGTGNVYVTGFSVAAGIPNGIATIKYSSAGDSLWVRRYSGNSGYTGYSIAVDGSGNVYVTGGDNSFGFDAGYATIKYNSAGDSLWVRRYVAPGNTGTGGGVAHSIAVDNSGNVYVTGGSSTASGNDDYATIKYNSSGVQQWVQRYNGPANGYDAASALAIDSSGNVYITGQSSGTGQDYATIKYNSSGVQQWIQRYNGPLNGGSFATSLALDIAGNVYITGYSLGSGTNDDYATIKYSPAAVFSTQFKRNNLNKPITDNQSTIDTISVNYTDLSGYTVLDVNLNIDTVIHTNDGDLEFYLLHNGITDTVVYQAGGSEHNFIGTVLNDSASTLITNGTAPFTGMYRPVKPLSQFNNLDIDGAWILKIYDRTTGNTGILEAWSLNFVVNNGIIGIQPVGNVIPKQFNLSQNYPNPFNPSTKIKFDVSTGNMGQPLVLLKIYDILGREVETLVNEQLKPGTYEVNWNAADYSSGVYFYTLRAENFIETKKMLIVK